MLNIIKKLLSRKIEYYDDEHFDSSGELKRRYGEDDGTVEFGELYKDKDRRIKKIKSCCEQIITANKNVDEAVKEYGIVTSYLSDVQKIFLADSANKKKIIDSVNNIQRLNEEREKFKKRKPAHIKQEQYAIMQQYEDDIVDEIKKMQNFEAEGNVIKSDLNLIEGERGALKSERANIISYQKFLKFFSKFTVFAIALIYLIIMMVSYVTESDLGIPLVITTVAAVVAVIYVTLSSRSNVYKLKVNEAKMNKLIGLANKVKIKYFNSINLVEYSHSKFGVINAKELSSTWNKYMQEKENINKNEKNYELLEVYQNSLVEQLKKLKVADPKIWLSQLTAFSDKNEMKEIKNRLEARRKKLNDRIDYNSKLVDEGKEQLKQIIIEKDEYKTDIANILREYNINVRQV